MKPETGEPGQIPQTQSVQLGVGTLIIIALIVTTCSGRSELEKVQKDTAERSGIPRTGSWLVRPFLGSAEGVFLVALLRDTRASALRAAQQSKRPPLPGVQGRSARELDVDVEVEVDVEVKQKAAENPPSRRLKYTLGNHKMAPDAG